MESRFGEELSRREGGDVLERNGFAKAETGSKYLEVEMTNSIPSKDGSELEKVQIGSSESNIKDLKTLSDLEKENKKLKVDLERRNDQILQLNGQVKELTQKLNDVEKLFEEGNELSSGTREAFYKILTGCFRVTSESQDLGLCQSPMDHGSSSDDVKTTADQQHRSSSLFALEELSLENEELKRKFDEMERKLRRTVEENEIRVAVFNEKLGKLAAQLVSDQNMEGESCESGKLIEALNNIRLEKSSEELLEEYVGICLQSRLAASSPDILDANFCQELQTLEGLLDIEVFDGRVFDADMKDEVKQVLRDKEKELLVAYTLEKLRDELRHRAITEDTLAELQKERKRDLCLHEAVNEIMKVHLGISVEYGKDVSQVVNTVLKEYLGINGESVEDRRNGNTGQDRMNTEAIFADYESLKVEKDDLEKSLQELQACYDKQRQEWLQKLEGPLKQVAIDDTEEKHELVQRLHAQKVMMKEILNTERFYLSRLYYMEMKEELESRLRQSDRGTRMEKERLVDAWKHHAEVGELYQEILSKETENLRNLTKEENMGNSEASSQSELSQERSRIEQQLPVKRELLELQQRRCRDHKAVTLILEQAVRALEAAAQEQDTLLVRRDYFHRRSSWSSNEGSFDTGKAMSPHAHQGWQMPYFENKVSSRIAKKATVQSDETELSKKEAPSAGIRTDTVEQFSNENVLADAKVSPKSKEAFRSETEFSDNCSNKQALADALVEVFLKLVMVQDSPSTSQFDSSTSDSELSELETLYAPNDKEETSSTRNLHEFEEKAQKRKGRDYSENLVGVSSARRSPRLMNGESKLMKDFEGNGLEDHGNTPEISKSTKKSQRNSHEINQCTQESFESMQKSNESSLISKSSSKKSKKSTQKSKTSTQNSKKSTQAINETHVNDSIPMIFKLPSRFENIFNIERFNMSRLLREEYIDKIRRGRQKLRRVRARNWKKSEELVSKFQQEVQSMLVGVELRPAEVPQFRKSTATPSYESGIVDPAGLDKDEIVKKYKELLEKARKDLSCAHRALKARNFDERLKHETNMLNHEGAMLKGSTKERKNDLGELDEKFSDLENDHRSLLGRIEDSKGARKSAEAIGKGFDSGDEIGHEESARELTNEKVDKAPGAQSSSKESNDEVLRYDVGVVDPEEPIENKPVAARGLTNENQDLIVNNMDRSGVNFEQQDGDFETFEGDKLVNKIENEIKQLCEDKAKLEEEVRDLQMKLVAGTGGEEILKGLQKENAKLEEKRSDENEKLEQRCSELEKVLHEKDQKLQMKEDDIDKLQKKMVSLQITIPQIVEEKDHWRDKYKALRMKAGEHFVDIIPEVWNEERTLEEQRREIFAQLEETREQISEKETPMIKALFEKEKVEMELNEVENELDVCGENWKRLSGLEEEENLILRNEKKLADCLKKLEPESKQAFVQEETKSQLTSSLLQDEMRHGKTIDEMLQRLEQLYSEMDDILAEGGLKDEQNLEDNRSGFSVLVHEKTDVESELKEIEALIEKLQRGSSEHKLVSSWNRELEKATGQNNEIKGIKDELEKMQREMNVLKSSHETSSLSKGQEINDLLALMKEKSRLEDELKETEKSLSQIGKRDYEALIRERETQEKAARNLLKLSREKEIAEEEFNELEALVKDKEDLLLKSFNAEMKSKEPAGEKKREFKKKRGGFEIEDVEMASSSSSEESSFAEVDLEDPPLSSEAALALSEELDSLIQKKSSLGIRLELLGKEITAQSLKIEKSLFSLDEEPSTEIPHDSSPQLGSSFNSVENLTKSQMSLFEDYGMIDELSLATNIVKQERLKRKSAKKAPMSKILKEKSGLEKKLKELDGKIFVQNAKVKNALQEKKDASKAKEKFVQALEDRKAIENDFSSVCRKIPEIASEESLGKGKPKEKENLTEKKTGKNLSKTEGRRLLSQHESLAKQLENVKMKIETVSVASEDAGMADFLEMRDTVGDMIDRLQELILREAQLKQDLEMPLNNENELRNREVQLAATGEILDNENELGESVDKALQFGTTYDSDSSAGAKRFDESGAGIGNDRQLGKSVGKRLQIGTPYPYTDVMAVLIKERAKKETKLQNLEQAIETQKNNDIETGGSSRQKRADLKKKVKEALEELQSKKETLNMSRTLSRKSLNEDAGESFTQEKLKREFVAVRDEMERKNDERVQEDVAAILKENQNALTQRKVNLEKEFKVIQSKLDKQRDNSIMTEDVPTYYEAYKELKKREESLSERMEDLDGKLCKRKAWRTMDSLEKDDASKSAESYEDILKRMTDENLSIADLIHELEATQQALSRGGFEKQASSLENANNELKEKVHALQVKNQELVTELDAFNESKTKTTKGVHNLESENKSLKELLCVKQNENSKNRDEIRRLENERDELLENLKESEERNKNFDNAMKKVKPLQEKLASFENDNSKLQDKVEENLEQINTLKEKLALLENENSKLRSNNDDLQKEKEDAVLKCSEKCVELEDELKSLNDLEKENKSLEETLALLKQENSGMKENLQAVNTENEEIIVKLNETKQVIQDTEEKLKSVVEENEALKTNLGLLEEENYEIIPKVEELENIRKELEDEVENLRRKETDIDSWKEKLKESESKTEVVEEELKILAKRNKEIEHFVEEKFGHCTQNGVKSTLEKLEENFQEIEREKKSLKEKVKQLQGIIGNSFAERLSGLTDEGLSSNDTDCEPKCLQKVVKDRLTLASVLNEYENDLEKLKFHLGEELYSTVLAKDESSESLKMADEMRYGQHVEEDVISNKNYQNDGMAEAVERQTAIEEARQLLRAEAEKHEAEKQEMIEQFNIEKTDMQRLMRSERTSMGNAMQNLINEIVRLKEERNEIRKNNRVEKDKLVSCFENERTALLASGEVIQKEIREKLEDKHQEVLEKLKKEFETRETEVRDELMKIKSERDDLVLRFTESEDGSGNALMAKRENEELLVLKEVDSKEQLKNEFEEKMKVEKKRFQETLNSLRQELERLQKERTKTFDEIDSKKRDQINQITTEPSSNEALVYQRVESEFRTKVNSEKLFMGNKIRELRKENEILKQQKQELKISMRMERLELTKKYEKEREELAEKYHNELKTLRKTFEKSQPSGTLSNLHVQNFYELRNKIRERDIKIKRYESFFKELNHEASMLQRDSELAV